MISFTCDRCKRQMPTKIVRVLATLVCCDAVSVPSCPNVNNATDLCEQCYVLYRRFLAPDRAHWPEEVYDPLSVRDKGEGDE